MTSNQENPPADLGLTTSLRILISIASVALIVPFMHNYASLVNSFVIALIIVMTAAPVMSWLMSKGIPGGIAFLLTMIGTLAVTLFLAFALVYSMAQFAGIISEYMPSLEQQFEELSAQLNETGIDVGPMLQQIEPQRVLGIASSVARSVLSGISVLLLLGLIIVFMLMEALSFPAKVEAQLSISSPIFPQIYSFSHSIRQYVVITAITGALSGVVVAVVLYLMGIEFAALWGFLFFILSFVPTVGFWLALIPPLILAALQFGAGMALAVVLFYIILSFILNQLIRPAYMGQGLDLSPLWIIVSLIVWSTILGAPGIIIGVPLTIMVKELFLETSEDTKWLAGLMSSQIPAAEPDSENLGEEPV